MTRSWMWAEACALLDEAERRHRQFFELLATPSAPPAWEPPVDIYASEQELLIVVALPGATPDSVRVQTTEAGLRISAEAPCPRLAPRASVVRMELPYGRMQRHVQLPAGRYALADQQLANGCLRVRLTRVNP